ncbi:mechanosensitive ion channel [Halobacteriovorax sp. GB3]|uniref:mechanosensitive ion channel family protein n=1 Tax=Halobacteriovorax sp. GB3 TaxID=2719615 RepID=UPI0023613A22|nr:mechanosensitive ion channel domain-containing protein [Halobacteriovorax sp. GB3]MDD0853571.1 mechanosensitive ion channel [Halobacteriovorax sp. GB3]
MKISIVVLFSLLISLCSFANEESLASREQDLEKIKLSFEKINIDYGILKIKKKEIAQEFAGLVSGEFDRADAKKNLAQVEDFEEQIRKLVVVIEEEKVRANDLKLDNKDIEQISGVKIDKSVNESFLSSIDKIVNDFSRLEKNINLSMDGVRKWKAFLHRKLRSDNSKTLFSFAVRKTLVEPVEEFKKLMTKDVSSLKETFTTISKNLQNKERSIRFFSFVTIAFLLTISLLLIVSKLKQLVDKNLINFTGTVSSGVFETLYHNKALISILVSFQALSLFRETTSSLKVLITVITLVIVPLLWNRCFIPMIDLVLTEINKSENEVRGSYPKIAFIFFFTCYILETQFEFNSDVISFARDILLIYVSYRFFKISSSIRGSSFASYVKKGSLFLSALNILTAVLSLLLGLSAFIAVIGYKSLGKELGNNLFESVGYFFWGWFLYHFILEILINFKKKIQLFELKEFFNSMVKMVNVVFFLYFIYVLVNKWAGEFLLITDIGRVELFTIASTPIYLEQPFQLVILFYVYRVIYYLGLSFFHVIFEDADEPVAAKKQTAHIDSVLKYFFIAIFIIHSFSVLGVTYKNLVLIASALGVGIGFGLQNIVNNFLSGIILLFERPVRVGDFIEIDSQLLQVKRIGIRSTIVESFENSNTVIPNSEILSNRLVNWTLNDNRIAVKCSVGVAYGSDPKQVSDLIENSTVETRGVMSQPRPTVLFKEFGDSSLNFTVRFWINRPLDKYQVQSDVMHAINKVLADNNITIPFPQRDVHIIQD